MTTSKSCSLSNSRALGPLSTPLASIFRTCRRLTMVSRKSNSSSTTKTRSVVAIRPHAPMLWLNNKGLGKGGYPPPAFCSRDYVAALASAIQKRFLGPLAREKSPKVSVLEAESSRRLHYSMPTLQLQNPKLRTQRTDLTAILASSTMRSGKTPKPMITAARA